MRRLIVEQPVSRTAVWSLRLGVFALAATAVAIALARLNAVDPAAALTVFGAALALAFLAALLAGSAAVVIWRTGRRGAAQGQEGRGSVPRLHPLRGKAREAAGAVMSGANTRSPDSGCDRGTETLPGKYI